MDDVITVRTWSAFFNGAKTRQGRQYLINMMRRAVEMEGLICIKIERISKQKWKVTQVITEENSYYVGDEEIILKADFYDTKSLLNAKPIKYINEFFGEITENRIPAEWNI